MQLPVSLCWCLLILALIFERTPAQLDDLLKVAANFRC